MTKQIEHTPGVAYRVLIIIRTSINNGAWGNSCSVHSQIEQCGSEMEAMELINSTRENGKYLKDVQVQAILLSAVNVS